MQKKKIRLLLSEHEAILLCKATNKLLINVLVFVFIFYNP